MQTNRYTYVLNNPLKYTNPSGYAYQGFGNLQLNSLSSSLLNSVSFLSQQMEDIETRRKAFMKELWGDVTLFDIIGRSGASANRQSYSSSLNFGFTPFYVTTPDAFVQNYYKHRVWLKEAKYLYERYGNMLPTKYQGGLTNSFEGFKNFMLDQVKNNPNEVSGFSFKYAGNNFNSFFVEPWYKNNEINSWTNPANIPGYLEGEISHINEQYHTHPYNSEIKHKEGISPDDKSAHLDMKIPINAIESNGYVFRYNTIIEYGRGNYLFEIKSRIYRGEKYKW